VVCQLNNSMKQFEYRVVHKDSNGFAIYKLYTDDKGEYYFVGNSPSSAWGLSVADLKADLNKFQEALTKPVISFDQIR
jgi:hypothetical protein